MDTIWKPSLEGRGGPKYRAVAESIREAIASGDLAVGAKLPPVRDLAWTLSITPGTVARAYTILTDDGVLEAAVGRGTFVAGRPAPAVRPDVPLFVKDSSGVVDLRSSPVPDVGQGRSIARVLTEIAARSNYTDYPSAETDHAARAAVADWIGQDVAGRIAPEDIVLAHGAQNAILVALQSLLTGPTPVILTEELTYPGVRHAARLLRARVVPVQMDQHGLRPDALEEACRAHGGQALITAAMVHSPTTRCTPLARKQDLAALARRFQLQVLEDDCFRLGDPGEAPAYRAMLPERGWYLSSLTKSVSSSLRFGFMACPTDRADGARAAAQSSFYGLPQPIIDLGEALIRTGEAARIRRDVLAADRHRVQLAVNALGGWDLEWRPDVPYVWLKLPRGWRSSTFAAACEARGVRIKSADEFVLEDGLAPSAVRIACNSTASEPQYEAALAAMAQLLANPPSNSSALMG
ncbi:aminotransferase-like domain-containing protein [Nioella nitratireducens]|uniref:aminotransferase-like domain-containing protein n=1 Tax=Nioella nitratireducens TaxID=1287720 RepID=UPI0008FD5FE5|nr:PLP-dependent aminotransferase family protein [Nioella nitratireducens]